VADVYDTFKEGYEPTEEVVVVSHFWRRSDGVTVRIELCDVSSSSSSDDLTPYAQVSE
jgi:hypothetical protein